VPPGWRLIQDSHKENGTTPREKRIEEGLREKVWKSYKNSSKKGDCVWPGFMHSTKLSTEDI